MCTPSPPFIAHCFPSIHHDVCVSVIHMIVLLYLLCICVPSPTMLVYVVVCEYTCMCVCAHLSVPITAHLHCLPSMEQHLAAYVCALLHSIPCCPLARMPHNTPAYLESLPFTTHRAGCSNYLELAHSVFPPVLLPVFSCITQLRTNGCAMW